MNFIARPVLNACTCSGGQTGNPNPSCPDHGWIQW
jgi:hypothetical protein